VRADDWGPVFELAANRTADFDRTRTSQLRFPRLRRRDIEDNDVNTGALHRIEAVKEHLAQFFGSAGAQLSHPTSTFNTQIS
jgi:hypothetical protein